MLSSKHRLAMLLAVILAIATSFLLSLQTQAAPPAHVGADLTPDEITAILNTHNDWRQRYGVPALVWDPVVAAVAQDWANQMAATGNFAHRPNNKYGENIWAGSTGFFVATDSVNGWGSEVADYNLVTNTCAAGKVCGHFTQLVWANTARLGCGKATGQGDDYYVCNYDPPGNFVGQNPGITKIPSATAGTNTPTATVAAVNPTTALAPTSTSTVNAPAVTLAGDAALFLNTHNDWRRKFGVPPLVWDETIAAVAAQQASLLAAGTPFSSLPGIPYGRNFWAGTAGFFSPADAVNSFGGQSADYDIATNTCAAGKSCRSFTQVVWSTTTKLGCARVTGGGTDYFYCAYDPSGNVSGSTPGISLVPAPTLTAAAAALTAAANAPTVGTATLTVTPTATGTLSATATLTSTAVFTATAMLEPTATGTRVITPTATITATTLVTATTVPAVGTAPTATPTATKQVITGTTGLSGSEATAMLDAHNEWRRRFGVPALVWDSTVAGVAQDWANQIAASGDFAHRPNNKYGENIWAGSTGFFVATDAVNGWGNEVDNYNLVTNTCAAGKVCGHFTQVVWSSSARLGCGKSTGQGNDYYVCNYDPPGNFTGETPGISSSPLPLNTPTLTPTAGAVETVTPDAVATESTAPDTAGTPAVPADTVPTATTEPATTIPDAAPPTNTSPASALDAGSADQLIPGGTQLWYVAPSNGAGVPITIRIPGAAQKNLMFMVFGESQIPDWQNELHIGISSEAGGDLAWTGTNPDDDGAYYIILSNNASTPAQVRFEIE